MMVTSKAMESKSKTRVPSWGQNWLFPAAAQHWTRLLCDDRMAAGSTPKKTYDVSPGTEPESGAGTLKPRS